MRSWMKWAAVGALGLCASAAIAADHTDGSSTNGVQSADNAGADIADLYAWPTAQNKLALIQTIHGATEFSPNVQYVFHVGRLTLDASNPLAGALGPAADQTDIICEFDASSNISCWAGDDYVNGDASGPTGILSDSGMLRVHANQHADPFFFYLTGLGYAITEVLQYGPAGSNSLVITDGCPDTTIGHPENTTNYPAGTTVAEALVGMLTGSYDDTGTATPSEPSNSFATNNVMAIVMEVDPSLLAGSGDLYQVHASTRRKN